MLNEIFRLFGTIVVDNESAKKDIDGTVDYAESQRKQLQQKLENFGKAATRIFSTAAIANAVKGIGSAVVNMANNTRDYRTQIAKLETAFLMNKFSADNASATYKTLYGVIGDTGRVVEAAGHIAQLANDYQDLNAWTTICTGVFATFGDSLPIESLTEAANETAKTGDVTGSLADALNWAGEDADEFQKRLDACNTEEERAEEITDTLVALYGDAARKYRENNSALIEANTAHDNLNNAMAKMGEKAEPVLTALTDIAAKLVESATPAVETMVSGMTSMLENFKSFGQWVEENKTIITAFLGSVALALGLTNAPLLVLLAAIALVVTNWNLLTEAVGLALDELGKFFTITIPQAWKDMCDAVGKWWDEHVTAPINRALAAINEFFGLENNLQKGLQMAFDGGNTEVKRGEDGHIYVNGETNDVIDALSSPTIKELTGGEYGTVPGRASGLDFVPGNDVVARLHYGEAVLTRSEANAWRRGQSGGIDYDKLAEAMAERPLAFSIDGKAFAVMLAREMNRAIGNRNIQTLMAMGG